MKVLCLKYAICIDSSNEQSAFDGLYKIVICSFISFLSLQLNEFLQSEIIFLQSKIIFKSKNHLH